MATKWARFMIDEHAVACGAIVATVSYLLVAYLAPLPPSRPLLPIDAALCMPLAAFGVLAGILVGGILVDRWSLRRGRGPSGCNEVTHRFPGIETVPKPGRPMDDDFQISPVARSESAKHGQKLDE